jgi:hypothetical protein
MGWMAKSMPRLLYPRERDSISIVMEAVVVVVEVVVVYASLQLIVTDGTSRWRYCHNIGETSIQVYRVLLNDAHV